MSVLATWQGLERKKQAMAIGAVAATVLALALLVRTASQPPLSLLYAGLDAQAAGEVIGQLDAEGVAYRVDGDQVLVPRSQRDALRMRLAREGLPRQSTAGYELLDSLSGFSTTSDMFSAAYWRAKEGELTRTVLGIPGVRAARVHIGAEARTPFARERTPRTASVTLTAPGGLDKAQVKAIQHLTALAVADMQPGDVAVIETAAGLLTGDEKDSAVDDLGRAASLERDLTRMLEAHVGRGGARVEVAMALSREREAWTERRLDPASAVVTTRKTTESTDVERASDAAVTVASDLPDGDAAPGEEMRRQSGETREEVAYDYAATERTGERMPGAIEALSVAVLLADVTREDGTTAPRPAAEIEALRALVAAAAGIDEARGDTLTVRSMPFDRPVLDEAPEPGLLAGREAQAWQAGQIGFLGLVALVLGLFVVRPILTASAAAPAEPALALSADTAPDPLTALRSAAIEEPAAAAALLQSWLEEEEAA